MSEKVKNYGAVLSFFVLEVLAFVSFTFTNMYFLFAIFGFFVMALIALLTYDEWKKKGTLSFLIFVIPLFIFALVSAISNYSRSCFSMLNNILLVFGVMSFACLGYLMNFVDGFKVKNALLVIYGGIFLLMAISFIYSMVYYVPFYTIIYKNMYIYYDGSRSRIDTSIRLLLGFEFREVTIQYFSLFATMLFTSVVGLRYISPKKETRLFIVYALFAFLGFIILLFIPNKYNLITDVLVVIFLLFVLFYPKKGSPIRIMKYVSWAFLAIMSVLFVIFFINSQSSWTWAAGLKSALSGNSLLNRLFNSNALSAKYKEALDGALSSAFLLGHAGSFDSSGTVFNGLLTVSGLTSTFADSWFFDTFYTGGIFAFIAIVTFLVFAVLSMVRYYKSSKDSPMEKSLVISFVGTFFIYGAFALPLNPEIHYVNFTPMARNAMFLVSLFLIGYTYTPKKEKPLLITEAGGEEVSSDEETESV